MLIDEMRRETNLSTFETGIMMGDRS